MTEAFVQRNDDSWLNMRYIQAVRANTDGTLFWIEGKIYPTIDNPQWAVFKGGYPSLEAAKKAAAQLTQGFDPSELMP